MQTVIVSHILLHSAHVVHVALLSKLPVSVPHGLSICSAVCSCSLPSGYVWFQHSLQVWQACVLVYTAKWTCMFPAQPTCMLGLGCQCAGMMRLIKTSVYNVAPACPGDGCLWKGPSQQAACCLV